jgi:hypothetical protein
MNSEKSDKVDLVPQLPSDLSGWRLEDIQENNPFYSFEHHFRVDNIWTAYIDVRDWLEENGITVDQYFSENQVLVSGWSFIMLCYHIDSEGEGVLSVYGHISAFSNYPDLVEVLKSDESPVEYKKTEVTTGMTSVKQTPYPWRFEFIYDSEDSFPYADTAILQWISDQEVVKFLDENKFKEPGDEHPTFVRIRETPEGKPILMLEGYSIEGGEILDHLTDDDSPFQFRKKYVVGQDMKKPVLDEDSRFEEANL